MCYEQMNENMLPQSKVLNREHKKTQTTTDTSNHTGQQTTTWDSMEG